MKTTTVWKSGEAFDSYAHQTKITIDGATGFSPKALLLSGLAGCSGIDVVMVLEKMRVPFGRLEMEVEASQTEDIPRVFKAITIFFRIQTDESNRDKVERAVQLSLDKYCGVAAMLNKVATIHHHIEILPE